ncbi:hypothetical protein Tco_0453665 [Tanacetum coccineum]
MVENVTVYGNNNGAQDGNAEQCLTPIRSNVSLNEGIVNDSPTDPNKVGPSFSGPTSYAKLVTVEPSRKSVNFLTLLAPEGNGADVAISLESVRAISESFANTVYGFFLGKWVAYPVVDNYVKNSWSKFGLNIVSNAVKNLKNPRQAARGVQVGPKVGYRPVSNRNNASTGGKKKQAVSVRKGPDSGVSPSNHRVFNVSSCSTSTTPIVERIDKLERQIIEGKLTLVDDDGKPLPKVVSTKSTDSDCEVEDVVDDYAVLCHDMSDNLQAICDDLDITVLKDSLSAKPQRAISDVFKSKTSTVRGGNTLTILLPFEEEQVELKLFSKLDYWKEHLRMEQKQIFSSSIYDQIPPLSANHQWIVAQNLDAKDETEVQIFYSVHDPLRHYRCQIPELLGKHIRGCFYGWVIFSDHPHNVMWSLWNPITSKVINLPRLIYKQSDSDYIDYCCLTSPPDDPNSILLMTRAQKPHFVFCRLCPSKKKLRWTEMSYAKQVNKVTGVDGFLTSLTCCNGKVYASVITAKLVVELTIVVKDNGVAINLLSLLMLPDLSLYGHKRRAYLVGTCKDLFCICIDFDEVTDTIGDVYLFKLDMNSKNWEELEDLKDATIILEIDGYLYPEYHSLAIGSELGGYIHILGENGRIRYSYHVKDKTISLSSVPCVVGTSHVSTWAMLECKRLLEGDHKQEKDKKDKTVVSKVKSHEVELIGTTDKTHLLNLPFDVIKSCVGVEYMPFRASCKLCYLAAPRIQWNNQTASKRLQSQGLSLVSPWLMVFGKHTITLIDPMFGDKYFIKTPQELELIGELKIHCSRYGWLLMRNSFGPLFFFNPFTSDNRKLPQDAYLESFDFSAPPTSPNCIVVGFTLVNGCHVHIHFVGRESSWQQFVLTFGNDDPYLYRFPAFYGGDVYALRNGKGVDVFKELGVGDHNWECKGILEEAPISRCTSKAQHFLVRCDHKYKCDQHLILVIVGEFGESVEVFIPNEDAGKWEKIDDIGRHMIYIGDKTCLCMEANTPMMENKIYFPRLHSGKIVFYSLETRKFHTFNGENILESFMDFFETINHLPHNAWIEPAWSAKPKMKKNSKQQPIELSNSVL